MVTLGEAARLTGLGKTTLARAIKAGRLSATRTDLGSYQIDPAELARVYPFPAPTGATAAATGPLVHHATPNAPQTGETPDATLALEAQIAGLRVSELLRRQLDDVREDRDRWRGQAERLALTAPVMTLAPVTAPRPWWKRLAG
jgi:excisionase family DNA binding protein